MEEVKYYDYINKINSYGSDREAFFKEQEGKNYNQFLTNRSLSCFVDTIYQANEMNRSIDYPDEINYLYYIRSVIGKKRFYRPKNIKSKSDIELIKGICEIFEVSYREANTIRELLSETTITKIREYNGQKNLIK